MKTNTHSLVSLLPHWAAFGLFAVTSAAVINPSARAADSTDITTVSSTVSDSYVRAKLADGSFKPETYAFGKGGFLSGSTRDVTIDKLGFMNIAHVVAFPLAEQNYVPSKNPKTTNLLIMVYWGTTDGVANATSSVAYQRLESSQIATPPGTLSQTMQAPPDVEMSSCFTQGKLAEDVVEREVARQNLNDSLAAASLEDGVRLQSDARNAMLLGYDAELAETLGLEHTSLKYSRDDLISEVEDSRYFVVLMAYDFQKTWQAKKPELLWVTRISVRAQGNEFQKVLPAMTAFASQYFGQDSHGLLRKPMPDGQIDIGESRSLGFVTK